MLDFQDTVTLETETERVFVNKKADTEVLIKKIITRIIVVLIFCN